jgi:hypothetical protein
MKERLWGWESLFMGAQLSNLGWAHLLGLRDMAEGGSGDGVFLTVGLCQGNLEERLPLWGP